MCSTATPSIVIAQESQVLDAVEKRTEMVSNVLQKIGILTIVIGIVVAGINLIFNRSNWIMVISLVIAGVVISQSGAIATMLME
jgi:type IV secretory pathway VirB2 component (pilin)